MRPFAVGVAALLLFAVNLRADDATGGAAAAPSQASLAQAAGRLSSPNFSDRQEATRILETAGQAAIASICRAAESGDREACQRAIDVLARNAFAGDYASRPAFRSAIEKLCDSANARASTAARRARRDVQRAVVDQVTKELTDFGAIVMPQHEDIENPALNVAHVQIGQGWRGGDERLSLLADAGRVPWLSLENSPVGDAGLAHVGRLNALERLYLGSSRVRGTGLPQLAPLSRLRYLSLKQLPVGDAEVAALPAFPALQDLGLDYTRITDKSLERLSRYPQLSRLWLDYTDVTDAGMAHLAKLPNLKTLFIPGTKITGAGLAELRPLGGLTYLSLKDTRLSAESLKHLGQLEQLETLGLDQTNITDEQLADLAPLARLKILWLSKTEIGDEGLKHLHKLTSLQVVYLHGSMVTAEGVEDLRRALPQCHVAR